MPVNRPVSVTYLLIKQVFMVLFNKYAKYGF
jgi:hypothetical protein